MQIINVVELAKASIPLCLLFYFLFRNIDSAVQSNKYCELAMPNEIEPD